VPNPTARLRLAQALCESALSSYWDEVCKQHRCSWEIFSPPVPLEALDEATFAVARDIGTASAGFSVLRAGYLISSFYTAMLPEQIRSRLGAYYRPPALAERLMDRVTEAGFDCGGGWGHSKVFRFPRDER
jgi:hypothetical protein